MSQVDVRFVSEGTGDRNGGAPARQTVSIHVGALRLEGGSGSATGGSGSSALIGSDGTPPPPPPPPPPPAEEDEDSGISDESSRRTEVEEALIKSTSRSPKISWDLLLLILFSGSGWGLLAVLLGLGFLFGVPIAMIVIGSVYMGIESCYDERIAVLLIIGGILSIFSVLTRATVTDDVKKAEKRHNHHHGHRHMWDETVEAPAPKKKRAITWVQFFHGMITLVDLVWMVATSIFVYRIYPVVDLDNDESEMYCARTLYFFAFIYLTVVWALFAISLLYLIIKLLIKSCVCVCSSPV